MQVAALIVASSSEDILANQLFIGNLLKYSANITQLLLYSSKHLSPLFNITFFPSGAETKSYKKLMNI